MRIGSISDRERLLLDLEFVQNLANPVYLHCAFLMITSSTYQLTNRHSRFVFSTCTREIFSG
jgi:hypothetical protein